MFYYKELKIREMLDQNLSVLILESDTNFSFEIENLIHEIGYHVLSSVTDFSTALAIIERQMPGLILVNISLQEQQDFAEDLAYIQQLKIPVIFLSNLVGFPSLNAHQSKNSIGYMIKPVDKFTLRASIETTLQSTIGSSGSTPINQPFSFDNYIFFKQKGTYQKVRIDDIYFFQANGDYNIAQTFRGEYTTSQRMNKLEDTLDKQIFMRIHRSYIMNITKVNSINIEENCLSIEGYNIPFSRRYKTELLERLPLL